MDADEVQPVGGGAGAVGVEREAELVEGSRHVHPAVVGAEAAGEDDDADAGEVELLRRCAVEGSRLLQGRRRQAALFDELVDAVDHLPVAVVAPGDAFAEVVGEPGSLPVGTEEAAEERDAGGAEGPQVQIVTAVAAGREHVRAQPGGGSRQLLDLLVEEAGLEHPPHQVPPSDPARQPGSAPAGEEHLAACLVQFLRDLTARLAAAHHEHAAGGQLGG